MKHAVTAAELRKMTIAELAVLAETYRQIAIHATSDGGDAAGHVSTLSAAESAELDRQCGITPKASAIGVVVRGAVQQFGVPVKAGR